MNSAAVISQSETRAAARDASGSELSGQRAHATDSSQFAPRIVVGAA
jgi:hypothetical protein